MKNKCCKFRFFIPLIIIGVVALLALAVHGLWNHVLTDVLNVKSITYWQALGILALAKILFGGFPCRGGRCGPGMWRERMMMKRWESLTPEEREKMRDEMHHRFGGECGGGAPVEPPAPKA